MQEIIVSALASESVVVDVMASNPLSVINYDTEPLEIFDENPVAADGTSQVVTTRMPIASAFGLSGQLDLFVREGFRAGRTETTVAQVFDDSTLYKHSYFPTEQSVKLGTSDWLWLFRGEKSALTFSRLVYEDGVETGVSAVSVASIFAGRGFFDGKLLFRALASVESVSVSGGNFDDEIYGTNGSDVLRGRGGDDQLTAGGLSIFSNDQGADDLEGGTGDDLFIIRYKPDAASQIDRIRDFSDGDVIEVGYGFEGRRWSRGVEALASGDGADLGLDEAEIEQRGSFAYLHFGVNAAPGSDMRIRLDGDFSESPLITDGDRILFGNGPLFTRDADEVDFNNLDATQSAAVEADNDLYHALQGDDHVSLPDTRTIEGGRWNQFTVFDAGAGVDTVNGGNLDDRIMGGEGDDHLNGGGGSNIAYFVGPGRDHALYFTNPLVWKSSGPDGSDTLTNFHDFTFIGSASISAEQAVAQLVSRDTVRAAVRDIQRLMDRDKAFNDLIADGRAFIAEASEAKSEAEVLIFLETSRLIVSRILEKNGGPIAAIADAAGQALGEMLATALSSGGQEEYRKAIGAGAFDVLKNFAETPWVENLVTADELFSIGRDLNEALNDWRDTVSALSETLDQIEDWRDNQARIRDEIQDIAIELRDDYGFANDLPKIRYEGESDTTPDVIDSLRDYVPPNPRDLGFANQVDGLLTSYLSTALRASETNLKLAGAASQGTGNRRDNKITGNDVDNTLQGRNGDDRLAGLNGADKLTGGQGNDRLSGGNGGDELSGNSGDDTLIGGRGADLLDSSTGNDLLSGGPSGDTLTGGDGDDRLLGGSGNDTIQGGEDDDKLDGGAGQDVLTGNRGADIFVFALASEVGSGDARDRITDLTSYDRIDLHAIDAVSGRRGNQGFDYIGGDVFSETSGELRYARGVLIGDIDGDGEGDFQIRINRSPHLDDDVLVL